jgi:phosphatidylglycerophosphatase A
VAAAVATLFGIGRLPFAAGTLASAVAVLLAWVIEGVAGQTALLVAATLAVIVGTLASDRYVRATGLKDPGACVIDELAGQWVACSFGVHSAAAYVVCFLLFRGFDVLKPWPISALESLPGGYGVMADDLGAGIFAGIVLLMLNAWHIV